MAKGNFRGIYPAPELAPAEFGLFSLARLMDHSKSEFDERFVRGFSFEYDTRPTVRLLANGGHSSATMFDGTGLARYNEVVPFFIEVEDFRSTFDLPGEDRFARVLKQIVATSQKAVERELANGYTARVDGTKNQYLTNRATVNFVFPDPSLPVTTVRALSALEDAISAHPIGEDGVIHMTRGMSAFLGATWLLMRIENTDGKDFHIESMNGTKISIGSGYEGHGPFFDVTTAALTSNVVTLTTSQPHYLQTGELVEISGLASTYNGQYTVTVTDATHFTYAKTNGDINSASVTGKGQMLGTTTRKWVYATGTPDVHLGAPEVVNESLAQGYDVTANQNNIRIKALRPAAVHFDPAIHYAIKVDMTSLG